MRNEYNLFAKEMEQIAIERIRKFEKIADMMGFEICLGFSGGKVTGKQWTAKTNDMPLIDATKNADEPKRRDLETLKRVCKNG